MNEQRLMRLLCMNCFTAKVVQMCASSNKLLFANDTVNVILSNATMLDVIAAFDYTRHT